ncbi:uncharacterized protein RSE6_00522 [Rhynchosporium secalis]|uniref:2EXR domain-containing protein n=1 Tax=Rhynchosporium secalis TaxID=38038 RepID=A0A1E1LVG9_RHYSE|nr:uncharacterized protein RSE6_00522 [Rhynchosporium secalis]
MSQIVSASKSSGQPATKQDAPRFESFSRLPVELRQMVWRFFEEWDVDLDVLQISPNTGGLRVRRPEQEVSWSWLFESPTYFSRYAPPALLHTSQEARTEGLRWYVPCFGTPTYPASGTQAIPPRIYIKWTADRLCILYPELGQNPNHNHPTESVLALLTTNRLRHLAWHTSSPSFTLSSHIWEGVQHIRARRLRVPSIHGYW